MRERSGVSKQMRWELQCLIVLLFGVCAVYSYWKGHKNGLVDGAEVCLKELEEDKIIKVDEKGEIYQYDRYYKE